MLTRRERDVLILIAHGCAYAEIASRLGVSLHTVGSHVRNSYRKLGAHSGAHAIKRALEVKALSVHDLLAPRAAPVGAMRVRQR